MPPSLRPLENWKRSVAPAHGIGWWFGQLLVGLLGVLLGGMFLNDIMCDKQWGTARQPIGGLIDSELHLLRNEWKYTYLLLL